MNTIPPPDDPAHDDGVLMAEATRVNTLLGRYVVRFLDADALRTEPISIEDERALARRVAAVAKGIHARADRRERNGNSVPLIPDAVTHALPIHASASKPGSDNDAIVLHRYPSAASAVNR